jgi:hypothetical protein
MRSRFNSFEIGSELFGPVLDPITRQYAAFPLGKVTATTKESVTCGGAVYSPEHDHLFLSLIVAQVAAHRLNA